MQDEGRAERSFGYCVAEELPEIEAEVGGGVGGGGDEACCCCVDG